MFTLKGLNCVLLLSSVSSAFIVGGGALLEINNGQKKAQCVHKLSGNKLCMSCKEIAEDESVECHWCSKWVTVLTHESNGTITAVSALQVIKEYRDRESHKLNVILHNIPESDSTETSAHISHDTKIVAGIADKIGIGSVDASTTMRLGEKI